MKLVKINLDDGYIINLILKNVSRDLKDELMEVVGIVRTQEMAMWNGVESALWS